MLIISSKETFPLSLIIIFPLEDNNFFTGFESIAIGTEVFTKPEKCRQNKTRYQSGFQKLVALAGQFSNHFLVDLRRLANLAI
jgi:hypothetical protein